MTNSMNSKCCMSSGSPIVESSDQRPKNNHNRIITGIGTPTSQSRIPRPMSASMNCPCMENAEGNDGFRQAKQKTSHQCPVFGIDDHGSAGGLASPFCNSSIECRSGERMKAIMPSRGGRLMVMPIFINFAQVA